MKKIFCAFVLLNHFFVLSQGEQGSYTYAASQFMALYNGSDYVGIFNLFDGDMKKALPRQKTIDFFTKEVKGKMGDITDMRFLELRRGAHIYRTNFQRATADILIALNGGNEISGFYISAPKPLGLPILERNSTAMVLPFNDQWFVFWGGTTLEQNHHISEVSQQYAYDLLMMEDGVSFQGNPNQNENYFAFGKEILAPCDARVVKVITGIEDNIPGETNPAQLTGNTVVLETLNNEFILFAHLMDNSVVVEEGQDIVQGTVLGKCGNSGNSTEPHLHLSLQNAIEMEQSTGARMYFQRIMVNGQQKEDYMPVKGDLVRNVN